MEVGGGRFAGFVDGLQQARQVGGGREEVGPSLHGLLLYRFETKVRSPVIRGTV